MDLLDEFVRPVLIADSQWVVIRANESFRRTYGIESEELEGKNIQDILPYLDIGIPLTMSNMDGLSISDVLELRFLKSDRSLTIVHQGRQYLVKICVKDYLLNEEEKGHFIAVESVKPVD